MYSSDQTIRVLFLNSCINGGGAGHSLSALLSVIDPRIDAHVVMPEAGVIAPRLTAAKKIHYIPQFPERLKRSPYQWPDKLRMPWLHSVINLFLLPYGAWRLVRLAQRIEPDAIYCNHMLAKPFGVIIGYALGIPVLFHSRSVHHIPIDGAFYSWLGDHGIVKRIICNSQASSSVYRTKSAHKVTVIPNSIDLEQFDRNTVTPVLREQYGIAPDKFVVGYAGRIHHKKGIDWLIESFAQLAQQRPDAILVIVGDNDGSLYFDAKGNYQSLARCLGVDDKVIFAGFQEDVRPYIADFDVLVFPSREPESFGRVLLEAMALQVPVITSNHGGAVEVVERGRHGVLVEVENVAELAEALKDLAHNPLLRQQMGQQGRQRVARYYDQPLIAKRIFDELVRAVNGQELVSEHDGAVAEKPI